MKELFQGYFGFAAPPGHTSIKIKCVWHDDQDPSLFLNFEDGSYRCFGCGKTGNIKSLVESDRTIEEAKVDQFHTALLAEPPVLEWIKITKGFTLDTIKKYKIGYNGGRYTFPVRDIRQRCINIRLYSPTLSPKIVSFGEGFGAAAFFPFPPLEEAIFLMEGETDTILARQLGLNAYTQTGGAGTWSDEFTKTLAGKKVIVCYDVDRAGRNGASKIVNNIKFVTAEVKNILLPLSGDKKDFSDWILSDGGTVAQLKEIVQDTPPYLTSRVAASMDNPEELQLHETGLAKWAFKPIQTKVTVAGKDRAPYLVPKKFAVECSANKKEVCIACPNAAGQKTYEVDWRDGKALQFINMKEEYKSVMIRGIAGIPFTCRVCQHNILEYQNIERLAVMQHQDWYAVADDVDSTLRSAYFLGSGIQANSPYVLRGLPMPDPRDQSAVIVIVDAEPVNDMAENVADLKKCEVFRVVAEDPR